MKRILIILLLASTLFAKINDELCMGLLFSNNSSTNNIAWHLDRSMIVTYDINVYNYKNLSFWPCAGIGFNFQDKNNHTFITNINCEIDYRIFNTNNFLSLFNFVIKPTYYTLWNDPYALEKSYGRYDPNLIKRTNHIFDIKIGLEWKYFISLLAGLNSYEIKFTIFKSH
jgi:hypothetical protein